MNKASFICVDFQYDFADENGKNCIKGKSTEFIKQALIPFLRENKIKVNEIISDYRLPRGKSSNESCVPGTNGFESLLPQDIKNKDVLIKCAHNPIWTRKNIGIPNAKLGSIYQDPKRLDKWIQSVIPNDCKTIILFGETMDCCIMNVSQELYFRGFDVKILYEATDPKVIDRYFSKKICPSCNNERLNKEGRMVTICNVRYPVASNYTFKEMLEFINEIETEYSEKELNKVRSCISALKEITLCSSKLGIDYLSLGQSTATLSTGESQRIKLLGAYLNHMSHILYIFDEPSKGLDARDYTHVMNMMKALKEENNTIIMVEHNIDMIKLADNIIEIGPKAGKGGGNIIGEGTFEELLKNKNTELSKCNSIKRITSEHDISDMVTYSGLNKNYLKNISISFPRNAITSIYGVSGSGKSTLLRKEIYPRALEDKKFDDCILVDSTPIGKNNKSIIATYVGIMDEIRTLFACTDQAKEANMDEKYFSFNQEEGCCSKCNGDGRIELEFFKDTFIKCPDCDGTRYNDTVLKIKYQNKNINEVLNLSILEALDFFINNNELNTICIKLEFLKKVGLGYLKIGDTTSSLSGGEASRLKLAKELMKGKKKNTLYLLDEPTIGLHFSDIDNLLLVINELAKDNTILAIEHNKQFLMNSDYYIELGPGAGILGGEVVYQGNKNNI